MSITKSYLTKSFPVFQTESGSRYTLNSEEILLKIVPFGLCEVGPYVGVIKTKKFFSLIESGVLTYETYIQSFLKRFPKVNLENLAMRFTPSALFRELSSDIPLNALDEFIDYELFQNAQPGYVLVSNQGTRKRQYYYTTPIKRVITYQGIESL